MNKNSLGWTQKLGKALAKPFLFRKLTNQSVAVSLNPGLEEPNSDSSCVSEFWFYHYCIWDGDSSQFKLRLSMLGH